MGQPRIWECFGNNAGFGWPSSAQGYPKVRPRLDQGKAPGQGRTCLALSARCPFFHSKPHFSMFFQHTEGVFDEDT